MQEHEFTTDWRPLRKRILDLLPIRRKGRLHLLNSYRAI